MPNWEERLRNIRDWARYGAATGCEGQLVTAWEQRNGSRYFNHAIDAAAPSFWKPGPLPSIESALAEGLARAHRCRKPRALAKKLIPLGRHWMCGHYQRRHVLGTAPADWIRYAILPDEVAALRDCEGLQPSLPAEFRLLAETRAHIARRMLLINRIALGREDGSPRAFRQLAAEAERLAARHARWWKRERYGNGSSNWKSDNFRIREGGSPSTHPILF
ncbi:MAG: hypothetical protein HY360_02845 [Verrucomicrobia bacterium]|nr:hypothetical protein [Verrucomicrobiota bacterium]